MNVVETRAKREFGRGAQSSVHQPNTSLNTNICHPRSVHVCMMYCASNVCATTAYHQHPPTPTTLYIQLNQFSLPRLFCNHIKQIANNLCNISQTNTPSSHQNTINRHQQLNTKCVLIRNFVHKIDRDLHKSDSTQLLYLTSLAICTRSMLLLLFSTSSSSFFFFLFLYARAEGKISSTFSTAALRVLCSEWVAVERRNEYGWATYKVLDGDVRLGRCCMRQGADYACQAYHSCVCDNVCV